MQAPKEKRKNKCPWLIVNRERIIVEKSKLSEATWKERDPKLRCTFMPTIQYSRVLGFRPCFGLNIKYTRWTIKPIKVEEKCHPQWQRMQTIKKNL